MALTKILLPLALLAATANGAVQDGPSPILRVTKMLEGIMAKVEVQGKMEQASYDKFAAWGEETLKTTAADISNAKKKIEDLQNTIMQLKGSLGALGASIKQLNTDIAENQEAQKDSESVREKEYSSYESEKTEAEQCIGALEASIKVLSSSSNKFLQNGAHVSKGAYQEAQLMSVAADVRGILQKPLTSQYISEEDLQKVKEFVSNPAGQMSALQTGDRQNPFGDYAPQSSQIQGILKGLYDSFASSLEKSNADEGRSEKAFRALMDTKKQEQKTLTSTLDKEELEFAEKKKNLADSQTDLDDTKADLESAEALFAETESTCKAKAAEFDQRSKLRGMELEGMKKALAILSSKDAQKAFKGAASLVQLKQTQHRAVRLHSRAGVSAALRRRAYAKLRSLAAEHKNLDMARIAVQVKSGSAFDKVIMMIDGMIADLRKEEQEDIEHRDRCEKSQNANSNEKEDLAHSQTVMKDEVERFEDKQTAMKKARAADDEERKDIEKNMADRLKLRNEEHEEFKRALEADTNAVKIISMAQEALAKFYEKKAAAASFAQAPSAGAPKVTWEGEGGNYEGQKGMSTNALGALDIIKEDLQKEIDTGRTEDKENQAQYEKEVSVMEQALKARKDSMEAADRQLAELGVTLEDKRAAVSQNQEDAKEADEMTNALGTDCKWVDTHFDKRRSARKAEIQGLEEAKGHLSKAGEGAEDDELDLDGD